MTTRKRLRLETPHRDAAEAPAITTLTETLQAVIQDVRLLREEQARREREYAETFRRQEEELRRLRGTNSSDIPQLSPLYIRASGDAETRAVSDARARDAREGGAVANGAEARVTGGRGAEMRIANGARARDVCEGAAVADGAVARVAGGRGAGTQVACGAGGSVVYASESAADASDRLGYKLKPDTYDGTVSLHEYFSQLNLIARANHWDDATKTIALASSLRGKARSVLETVQDVERLDFAELKAKLELRFGEGRQSQNCYVAFTNRKQKFGEELAALGSEIDKLSRLAYPECPYELRDKIACAQFITAVSDNFIRRALQMEGITSLNLAVERAKALKIIQGDNSERYRENLNKNFVKKGDRNLVKNEERDDGGKAEGKDKEGKGPKGNWRGSKFGAQRGPTGILELIKPWKKFGSAFIGQLVSRMLKIGAGHVKSASLKEVPLGKGNPLYKSTMLGHHLREFKWMFLAPSLQPISETDISLSL
ncbi:uncharacterized protein [Temnothorax nylanderi]|uniref:uncharacterized protein n=1 Tax=Temnothorax nylanderi TaxID=102681 RepID=UPI003A8490A2